VQPVTRHAQFTGNRRSRLTNGLHQPQGFTLELGRESLAFFPSNTSVRRSSSLLGVREIGGDPEVPNPVCWYLLAFVPT
jgi:hypothetical protein